MTVQEILDASACFNCQDDRTLQLINAGLLLQITTGGSSSTALTGYSGAAALRARTDHVAGNLAFMIYYVSAGDGSQGWFEWDATSTAADDGVSVIRATDNPYPAAGAWVRLS